MEFISISDRWMDMQKVYPNQFIMPMIIYEVLQRNVCLASNLTRFCCPAAGGGLWPNKMVPGNGGCCWTCTGYNIAGCCMTGWDRIILGLTGRDWFRLVLCAATEWTGTCVFMKTFLGLLGIITDCPIWLLGDNCWLNPDTTGGPANGFA